MPAPSPARRALWLVSVALTGAVVMALELVAFRLYAPYLGYSLYVWGPLIAVILAAMAVGSALGGRLADVRPSEGPLFGAVLVAGLHQLVMLFAAHPLLESFSDSGELWGTTLATLCVFGVPVLLLAGVGPFVVRLAASAERVGTTAGRVSALATTGSIAGVLLTSFVLVPELGTRRTLQVCCVLTLAIGAGGLVAWRRAGAVALLPIVLVPLAPEREWSGATVFAGESPYNSVRVQRTGSATRLVLNRDDQVHSALADGQPWTGGYWDDFAAGPLLVRDARRCLVLGMGAGTAVRALRRAAPALHITAVEIDPLVVRVAAAHFGVAEGPRLDVRVADARRFVQSDDGTYDVIEVDLFHGGPEVPFHVVTTEFYRAVRARLNAGGAVLVNVFDPSPERQLLGAVSATLAEVFGARFTRTRAGINHLVLAFVEPVSLADVRARLVRERPELPGPVQRIARELSEGLRPLDVPAGVEPLSDDRAPIEALTKRVVRAGTPRR